MSPREAFVEYAKCYLEMTEEELEELGGGQWGSKSGGMDYEGFLKAIAVLDTALQPPKRKPHNPGLHLVSIATRKRLARL